ncbi:Beta-ketoacyl-[acyl-carrier-protein] synthase FabY [Zhongshania aliphaticivorans]|uniref:Beta-ketoacyl-[acyl-carrier-protein] synthase FabY n=1 Tax=Zhongshania aliphaticivorans TaxID=1470434 RepID=A0A5S9QA40_9GAMM|nr:beta-ketoacyl synthase [Zhongshania aliphaticivorans]CAA0087067.1 Beta-ketoacyl-[acyl-carrier-protein] synthase FabY [Zhongshania aliphaticivorans]CAA0114013.1 Beta-ketoacyl-[acyl-carrier-protein] synthase FabY [Zhongshania aliphaticivorans]
MSKLPVIVGFGGVNAAGRSSFHHGYRRLILDALPEEKVNSTYRSLAAIMGIPADQVGTEAQRKYMRDHTLIRKIESNLFKTDEVAWNKRMNLTGGSGALQFVTRARDLPDVLPTGWEVTELADGKVSVSISDGCNVLLPTTRKIEVSSAGQLPSGFDPASLYGSRNHPRGLQMAICGASDALKSMGIEWQTVMDNIRPDQMGVYASSAMSQLDENGFGGLLGARANGGRVSSKQLALGLPDMPADFVSAYVLGSVGTSGPSLGACATFFYNLRQAVNDIRNGLVKVAVVGVAESGLDPKIIDGYYTMGALASDADLLKLDEAKGLAEPDYRRASRPFSTNCGFTIAESSQFIVLFDDELALQLGAQIHGSVADVFVNADGYKKSISSPGVGNYLTVAKAVAAAAGIIGDKAIKTRSFVQSHGTSTPQNRVTESHILNETAKVFGIENWPVGAIKAYLGHSIGAASGDQLISSLGVWQENILPGIATIDHIADDVHCSNLQLNKEHTHFESDSLDVAILNAKGFGGNNASVALLSPLLSEKMLKGRHGAKAWQGYMERREQVQAAATAYDESACANGYSVHYQFGQNVLDGDDLELTRSGIGIKGWAEKVALNIESPYASWLEDKD